MRLCFHQPLLLETIWFRLHLFGCESAELVLYVFEQDRPTWPSTAKEKSANLNPELRVTIFNWLCVSSDWLPRKETRYTSQFQPAAFYKSRSWLLFRGNEFTPAEAKQGTRVDLTPAAFEREPFLTLSRSWLLSREQTMLQRKKHKEREYLLKRPWRWGRFTFLTPFPLVIFLRRRRYGMRIDLPYWRHKPFLTLRRSVSSLNAAWGCVTCSSEPLSLLP